MTGDVVAQAFDHVVDAIKMLYRTDDKIAEDMAAQLERIRSEFSERFTYRDYTGVQP